MSVEARSLIRRMSLENPLWGAPRIHGELLKLGYNICESTIAKYMARRPGPPSQAWQTFIRNHMLDFLDFEQIVTAPRSPWQNGFCERVIGTIRRECLDHVIVWNEKHLRRILKEYLVYYHESRTHLGLGKDAPEPRAVQTQDVGPVASEPVLGGLHHRYYREAV